MGRRWQIELPITKPMSLNFRTHYMVKAKLTREMRQAAKEIIDLYEIPPLEHLTAGLFYSPRDARVRDPINLVPTLKACEDALQDCSLRPKSPDGRRCIHDGPCNRVVPNDDPRYVRSLMPEILPKNEDRRGYLWLVIEES